MFRAVTVEKPDLFSHVSKLAFADFFSERSKSTSKFKKHVPFPTEPSWLETVWVAILR